MKSVSDHPERCRDCKERVRQLLTAVYGECLVSYSFPWPTKPDHYRGTTVGDALERISESLQQLRGYRNFIRTEQMPPCDYYLPDPGFIVEYDERQHFTRPRMTTLSCYPPEFKVGFSIAQWLQLCRRIDAVDDDPPDRDERRAWYDSLRDLVPTLHGFQPTARLYSEAFRWCSLSQDSDKDLGAFRSLLKPSLPDEAEGGIRKRPD
jgi:hypothetical protein